MKFNRTPEFRTSVAATSVIEPSLQSSISFDGVTFGFDRPMPVGSFATGEPFVISDQAFQITTITPAAEDVQGDGFIGHGAMLDPYVFSDASQGFDGYLSAASGSASAANTPYASSMNVDPAVSGPLSIASGAKNSVVKSIRRGSVSGPENWQTIEKYVVLTVLDVAPPLGAVRPGISGSLKRLRKRSDVVFTPRGFTLPGSFPSVATMLAAVPPNLGAFCENAEARRRFRLDSSYNEAGTNYSGDFTEYYARLVYALNSTTPTEAERSEIIDRILVFAGDVEAVLDAGGSLGGGAGQGGGVWLWAMAAAALTRDVALLQKIHASLFQPQIGFWVGNSRVGQSASGKSGVAAQTYFPEQIGIPHIEPDERGSHHGARYLNIGAKINGWEIASILAFAQGPQGFPDGRAMILNGGANDATNADAAVLNFLSRWRQFAPSVKPVGGPAADWIDVWDQLLGLGAADDWTGQPDQPPKGNSAISDTNGYFSAGSGSGEIDFSDRGIAYATETITRVDLRYSEDGVQWIEISDVTLTSGSFTISGLTPGAAYWCGWRRHSQSGASPWSANFPYNTPITSGADADKVTAPGSAVGATPVNTIAPVIHFRPYPAWGYGYWLPSPANIGIDDIELAAGVGSWTGYPAPEFSYQWKRNGSNIAGATTQSYTRTASDAGADLTCDVTASNSSGSTSAITNAVTAPSITVLSTGTLIDTDFRGRFAIDYQTEWAAVSTFNATSSHEPVQGHSDLAGVDLGAIRCDKSGARPHLELPFQQLAVPGTTYDVEAQVVTSWSSGSLNGFTGTLEFSIRNSTGTEFFTATLDPVIDTTQEVLDIVGSFTLPTGEVDTALMVRIRNSAAEGGSGRGDPMLHRLRVIGR